MICSEISGPRPDVHKHMKFCPICETRYDEEILRFCTKDGTPLIDEDQPNFVDSEKVGTTEEVDFGEETIIRMERPEVPKAPPEPEIDRSEAPRIVISTTEDKQEQRVRARTIPPYQSQPSRPNTAKVVVLTIVGTVAVLAFGLLLFYFLQNEDDSSNTNMNVNTNPPNMNVDLNTNLNVGNFNYNVNSNITFNGNFGLNLNTNVNANRSPSPTPKLSPSPSPSVSPTVNSNLEVPANTTLGTPRPTPTAVSAPPGRPANVTPTVRPTSNTNHQ